jgi:hypothetical protein
MNNSTIIYHVEPAMQPDAALVVKLDWVEDRQLFTLEITRGFDDPRRWEFKEHPQIQAILVEASQLVLPLAASEEMVLDGTAYELQVGGWPGVTLNWGHELPSEWAALAPMIAQLNALVKGVAGFSPEDAES